jgi:hypothetical protein
MMMSKLRAAVVVFFSGCGIAAGAAALTHQQPVPRPPEPLQARATAEPERRDSISFQKVALTTDDLVEATGLDIYKFRVQIAKGERFRVVLRAQERKDLPPHELVGYSFEKTAADPAIVGVTFLRLDRKLSGFLMSNELQAEYRLTCSNCKQGGISTILNNPLGALDSTHRTVFVCHSDAENEGHGVDAKETLLLRACDRTAERGVRGVNVDGYPRAEVVVVKEP